MARKYSRLFPPIHDGAGCSAVVRKLEVRSRYSMMETKACPVVLHKKELRQQLSQMPDET